MDVHVGPRPADLTVRLGRPGDLPAVAAMLIGQQSMALATTFSPSVVLNSMPISSALAPTSLANLARVAATCGMTPPTVKGSSMRRSLNAWLARSTCLGIGELYAELR